MKPGGGYTAGAETNPQFFMDALLGRYTMNPQIFRCPADRFAYPGYAAPYVRSVTMNIWMNDPHCSPSPPSRAPLRSRLTIV